MLDVRSSVCYEYEELKEVCVFLLGRGCTYIKNIMLEDNQMYLLNCLLISSYPFIQYAMVFRTISVISDDAAFGIYVTSNGSEFEYRGNVSNLNPSVALPLQWPRGNRGECPVQIGIRLVICLCSICFRSIACSNEIYK